MNPWQDAIRDRLRSLQATNPHIEACAVVTPDGLSIASLLPADADEDRIAAMSAAMLLLGERISQELGRGQLQQIFVRGSSGVVILMAVGRKAVLSVLAPEEAKLGLVFMHMNRAVIELESIMQG